MPYSVSSQSANNGGGLTCERPTAYLKYATPWQIELFKARLPNEERTQEFRMGSRQIAVFDAPTLEMVLKQMVGPNYKKYMREHLEK